MLTQSQNNSTDCISSIASIRRQYPKNIIMSHLNKNSLQNWFELNKEIFFNNIDVFPELNHSHKKVKDSLETRTVLIEISVMLKFIKWPKTQGVRNSRVMKSNYKTELHKMTSHFESLTRKFLYKFLFRVTNSTS